MTYARCDGVTRSAVGPGLVADRKSQGRAGASIGSTVSALGSAGRFARGSPSVISTRGALSCSMTATRSAG